MFKICVFSQFENVGTWVEVVATLAIAISRVNELKQPSHWYEIYQDGKVVHFGPLHKDRLVVIERSEGKERMDACR